MVTREDILDAFKFRHATKKFDESKKSAKRISMSFSNPAGFHRVLSVLNPGVSS